MAVRVQRLLTGGTGAAQRDHIAQLCRQTGKTPEELGLPADADSAPEIPDIPCGGEQLWQWFWELDSGRNSGMNPCPLGWADMAAWAALTGIALAPWQALLLRRMDGAWLNACRAAAPRSTGAKQLPPMKRPQAHG